MEFARVSSFRSVFEVKFGSFNVAKINEYLPTRKGLGCKLDKNQDMKSNNTREGSLKMYQAA
jgi:hypothetical protein